MNPGRTRSARHSLPRRTPKRGRGSRRFSKKMGRLQWFTDLGAAIEKARAEKKPLLVIATPGAPDGYS